MDTHLHSPPTHGDIDPDAEDFSSCTIGTVHRPEYHPPSPESRQSLEEQLQQAILDRNLVTFYSLLLERNDLIRNLEQARLSPLFDALLAPDIVEALLHEGADIYAKDRHGSTVIERIINTRLPIYSIQQDLLVESALRIAKKLSPAEQEAIKQAHENSPTSPQLRALTSACVEIETLIHDAASQLIAFFSRQTAITGTEQIFIPEIFDQHLARHPAEKELLLALIAAHAEDIYKYGDEELLIAALLHTTFGDDTYCDLARVLQSNTQHSRSTLKELWWACEEKCSSITHRSAAGLQLLRLRTHCLTSAPLSICIGEFDCTMQFQYLPDLHEGLGITRLHSPQRKSPILLHHESPIIIVLSHAEVPFAVVSLLPINGHSVMIEQIQALKQQEKTQHRTHALKPEIFSNNPQWRDVIIQSIALHLKTLGYSWLSIQSAQNNPWANSPIYGREFTISAAEKIYDQTALRLGGQLHEDGNFYLRL